MRRRIVDPFAYYTERQLIAAGGASILIGSLLAWWFGVRYDGVIDLHFGAQVRPWQPLFDNIVNVGSLFIPLAAFGLSVNNRMRLVDVFAAVLVARIPYAVLPLMNIDGLVHKSSVQLLAYARAGGSIGAGAIVLNMVLFAVTLAATVILVYWLFQGFKTATNSKKVWHKWAFGGCMLAGEVISKIMISTINY
jgi:hypothetical protein